MNDTQPGPVYLPPPTQRVAMSLEEAIARRRSVRDFSSEPVTQAQLSRILWAAQGVTETAWGLRAVPSAGATYPLEFFIVCGRNSLEGIGEGIFSYNTGRHTLTLHRRGDARLDLARAALGQEFICQAPLDIIICAVLPRTTRRYGSRGERYVHIEVGHAGQNIYLQAVALGLATVAVGAFNDAQVGKVLQLKADYQPLYIMPLGRPV